MLRSALTLSLISLTALSAAAETASARLVRGVGDGYPQLLTRENPMRRP